MKKDSLTNTNKKSIIHSDGSVIALSFQRQLRRFKGIITSALSSLSTQFLKPHKGWKDEIMKNFMALRSFGGKNSGRLAATGLVLVASLLIAACGGGGGGGSTPGPTPIPAPVITATLTADKCDVQSGNNLCNVTASYGTTNATSVTLTDAGGKVLSSKTTDTLIVNVLLGSNTYTVTATGQGGVVSKTLSATGSCAIGSAPSSTGCGTTVLHYTDKTYAVWTYAYPYAVTKTGVTKVVNKTSYPLLVGNVYSLSKCWLPEKALADGKVLVNCQEPVDNTRKVFYIDPTKDEMYDYAGVVPTDIVWHDVNPVGTVVHQPGWGPQAKVSDGWFYTFATSNWVLWFLDDKTGASAVVKTGTLQADGNINYMNSYSN